MKSFDDAMVFVIGWAGAFDNRDKNRFLSYVPFDRVEELGFELKEGTTEDNWGVVKEWSEEQVLKDLKTDVFFAREKAEDQRGISAACMFATINMWCRLLENDLYQENYDDYGLSYFNRVIEHYGWDKDSETKSE